MSSHFTPIKSVPNQAVDYLIMPYIIQPDCIIRNALRQKKNAFFPYLTTQKLQTCPRLLIKSAIAYRLHLRQHRSYRPIQSFRLSLSLHVAYIKESRRMACSRCQSKKLCVCVSFSLGPLLHAHLIMFVARLRSQNVRKRTFWHVRQQRLKSACASAQSDQSFCPYEDILHHWLFKMRTVMILMRLCECAGWYETSLCAQFRRYISGRWRLKAKGLLLRNNIWSRTFDNSKTDTLRHIWKKVNRYR